MVKPNFDSLVKEISSYDSAREKLINQARVVLKSSKQLIFALHRSDLPKAKSLYSIAVKEKLNLDKIASHNKRLFFEGSYSDAVQEYVEALCLYHYISSGSFPSKVSLKVSTNDYLLGVCDFTGELTRRAVMQATKQQYAEVARIHDLVDSLHGEFLKFDLRNSPLRKKYDQIKWNLAKIEDIMFDISKRI